jgi:hypothetical protein
VLRAPFFARRKPKSRKYNLKTSVAQAHFSGILRDMDWQQLLSLTIVAAAAGLLLRRKLRRPRFSFQHDTACGCAGVSNPSPKTSIVFRARKGERPQVRVKIR